MALAKLVEKRNEFKTKSEKLHKVFKQAGTDFDMSKVIEIEGTSEEKVAFIQKANTELANLGKEIDALVALEQASQDDEARSKMFKGAPPQPTGERIELLSIGKQFADLVAQKKFQKNVEFELKAPDVKTLFERSAGWTPESVRSGRVDLSAQRPIQVIDLIPQGTTDQAAYKYMEETTFTNNAAEVAEANQYGEAALALMERSQTVEKIAVFLPVTDEQLEDVAGIESYVDQRLRFMIRQKLDYQLLQGDGVTPNLLGVYNKPSIQSQAKGGDPTPDAFYKAMVKIMVTGQANPSAILMHPNDWQDIRLLRTTDGIYIWGNPSEAGPERMWGLPVGVVQAATEGTGLVGDFAGFSMFFTKRALVVKVSDSHSDYFIKGKQAIRADMRGVNVIFRASAFCEVTGI